MSHGGKVDPDRRRLTIDLDAELADWLHTESKRLNQGAEIYIESALRDYRAVIDVRRAAAVHALTTPR